MSAAINVGANAFADLLRAWRSRRRISQLDLALEAGISQRHISFLETGRSRPSRMCVGQLGQALEMPAAEVDAMLISAGYAGRSSSTHWDEKTRAAIDLSIDHVLTGHEPFPAVAIDRMWNLLKANQSAQKLFYLLGAADEPNLLRAILGPGALRDKIINWPDVARGLFRLYELEVARRPNDAQALALLDDLRAMPEIHTPATESLNDRPSPVMTMQFRVPGAVLKLFSLIATVGMSADAAIDDMRIETLLPADDTTRQWFIENIANTQ